MRTFLKRLFGIPAALLALSILAAACGASPTVTPAAPTATRPPATTPPGVTPTTPPSATARPAATATPQPTATPAPVSSGEVTIALPSLGDFDLIPGAGAGGSTPLWEALYTFFIDTKADGQLDSASGLVSSWTANADSSAWSFKLRDSVIFSNGERVVAQDVSYTLSLASDPNAKFSRANEIIRSLAKVETPDAATVNVTLNAKDIFWHMNFLSRVTPLPSTTPKLVVSKKHVSAIGLVASNRNPLGSGPYKLRSIAVGDRVVMEAVERHFFFGVPRTKTLTFLVVPEEGTRMALLGNKTVDATPLSLGNTGRAKQAGLALTAREGSLVGAMWISQYPDAFPSGAKNPFANEAVRKALFWHAIDRKALVDSFLAGQGRPSVDYPVFSWDVGNHTPWPVPAYDVAKAKTLLAQAGFTTGIEVDFYALQVTNPTGGEQIMEAIAVYWEAVGVKINRLPYTGNLFTQRLTAVYDKGGFAKPTIQGLQFIGNRPLSPATALLQHDPKAIFSVNRDAEGARLATAWTLASSIDDYKRLGQAYRQYAYEHALTWLMLFEANEVWARTDRVPEKWALGKDPPLIRAEYAAALR